MKSIIIKGVTQTQFETCVTAFIALDFKLRREKLLAFEFEIISKLDSYFSMTVKRFKQAKPKSQQTKIAKKVFKFSIYYEFHGLLTYEPF